MNSPRLVSLKELAAILGRSESSIRYHLRLRRITPTVRLGRSMSFDPNHVLDQLKREIPKTK